jgi:hypothetical protein
MKFCVLHLIYCLTFLSFLSGCRYFDKEAEAEKIVSNLIDLYKNTDFSQLRKKINNSPQLNKQQQLEQGATGKAINVLKESHQQVASIKRKPFFCTGDICNNPMNRVRLERYYRRWLKEILENY